MDIKEIIDVYGKNDYYDMLTGKTYCISKMEYHLFDNTTWIPVNQNGKFIGYVKIKGNLVCENKNKKKNKRGK